MFEPILPLICAHYCKFPFKKANPNKQFVDDAQKLYIFSKFCANNHARKQVSNSFSGKISPTIITYGQCILETLFLSSDLYQNYVQIKKI